MLIKKGTLLRIKSDRHGVYNGVAFEDFSTEDEWYRVKVAEGNGIVRGLRNEWEEGEEVPCRKGLNRIEILA